VFIKGLSGSVKKVYRADVAVLTFGNFKQENQDVVSFDMTPLSDDIGTQISGILGFNTLYLLEMGICLTHHATMPSMRGWKTILGT
jgi:hypothetical protein